MHDNNTRYRAKNYYIVKMTPKPKNDLTIILSLSILAVSHKITSILRLICAIVVFLSFSVSSSTVLFTRVLVQILSIVEHNGTNHIDNSQKVERVEFRTKQHHAEQTGQDDRNSRGVPLEHSVGILENCCYTHTRKQEEE